MEKDRRKDLTDESSRVHQVVYGNDIRVVETEVPFLSQESYEIVPEWPPGEPVPHYDNEPPRSPLRRFMDLFQGRDKHGQQELAQDPDPPIPNFISVLVGEKQSIIETHYHVHFSTYTPYSSTRTEEGPDYKLGPGILYTVKVTVDTTVNGQYYQFLQVEVFHSSTTGDNLLSGYGLVPN